MGNLASSSKCVTSSFFANLLFLAFCSLAATINPQTVSAAIFACQINGTVIYQDRPCPLVVKEKVQRQNSSRFPMDIHESWFDLPLQANERAFCDRRGCECGNIEKKHVSSLAQAIADALYVDGSWHRYESSYTLWMAAPTSSNESYLYQDQMLDAACEVMMAQTLLRKYSADALAVLHKRVTTAEELGFDVEQPCNDGIENACSYFDSVQLMERIKKDAMALRRKRGDNLLSQPTLGAGAPTQR